MFTQDFVIDSVQNAKKTVVNTFVTNDAVKKELVNLIDSQTEFVKGSVKHSLAIAQALVKHTSDAIYSAKTAKAAK